MLRKGAYMAGMKKERRGMGGAGKRKRKDWFWRAVGERQMAAMDFPLRALWGKGMTESLKMLIKEECDEDAVNG